MDLERLTSRSREALRAALDLARDRSHPEAGVPHLLRALLDQPEGLTLPLLQRAGANPADVHRRLGEVLDGLPAAYGATGEPRLAEPVVRTLNAALEEASGLGDEYVSTEHLVLAMLAGSDRTATLLREAGLERARVLEALQHDPRHAARHVPRPGDHLRGAREVLARPHAGGARGQARPGHRA
jgi:ATP-dependent Clp protease ATP-binding subunit ClpB